MTAIDNYVEILRNDGTMDNRCDAMLTYTDNIVFVELKDQAKHWITHAVEQLEKPLSISWTTTILQHLSIKEHLLVIISILGLTMETQSEGRDFLANIGSD